MRILDVIRCDRNEGEEKRVQNTLFISAVTGEKKLRPDVIAIVQNEITVVDEHIPAPGEIQSDETIVLPEIVSMTEYIRRHCENEIVDACINQIDMLRLCVVYEGKLFHDVPGLGPVDYGEEELVLTDGPTPSEWGEPCAHSYDPNVYVADVRPVDGSITWMSFRRIADGCIEADLTIEMEINFRYGSYGRFKRITQKYYTTACKPVGCTDFRHNDDIRQCVIFVVAPETHVANGTVRGGQRQSATIQVKGQIQAPTLDALVQCTEDDPLAMLEDVFLHGLYLGHKNSFRGLFRTNTGYLMRFVLQRNERPGHTTVHGIFRKAETISLVVHVQFPPADGYRARSTNTVPGRKQYLLNRRRNIIAHILLSVKLNNDVYKQSNVCYDNCRGFIPVF